jgi:CHAT domain-containing protein
VMCSASAFQLAGYRHVIGTLWPVIDNVALHAATTFYKAIGTGDGLSLERVPDAVNEIARRLRARFPDRPDAWAAFVHSGA